MRHAGRRRSICKWLPARCPRILSVPLCALRRLEKAADTLAHRRAAESAMNRLLAAALATGWTGPELGLGPGHDADMRSPIDYELGLHAGEQYDRTDAA